MCIYIYMYTYFDMCVRWVVRFMHISECETQKNKKSPRIDKEVSSEVPVVS